MKTKKCATSKASKRACRRAEGCRQRLAEDFLAHLYHCWLQHGHEVLDRLGAERPEVYFKAMVVAKLPEVMKWPPY